MAGLEYRNVSDHVEDLHGGRTLAPGESVKLTKEELREDHNERLLAEGTLIPVSKGAAEHEAKLAAGRAERAEAKIEEELEAQRPDEGGEQEEGGS